MAFPTEEQLRSSFYQETTLGLGKGDVVQIRHRKPLSQVQATEIHRLALALAEATYELGCELVVVGPGANVHPSPSSVDRPSSSSEPSSEELSGTTRDDPEAPGATGLEREGWDPYLPPAPPETS